MLNDDGVAVSGFPSTVGYFSGAHGGDGGVASGGEVYAEVLSGYVVDGVIAESVRGGEGGRAVEHLPKG